MANKNLDTNLDKKIEATLKSNLNSISASDDLIAKTLMRLNEEQSNKGAKVSPMPVKRKKHVPIALISSIAAGCIAVAGVAFLIYGRNSAKTAVPHNMVTDSAIPEIANTYKSETAKDIMANDEVYEASADEIPVTEDSIAISPGNFTLKTEVQSTVCSDTFVALENYSQGRGYPNQIYFWCNAYYAFFTSRLDSGNAIDNSIVIDSSMKDSHDAFRLSPRTGSTIR